MEAKNYTRLMRTSTPNAAVTRKFFKIYDWFNLLHDRKKIAGDELNNCKQYRVSVAAACKQ